MADSLIRPSALRVCSIVASLAVGAACSAPAPVRVEPPADVGYLAIVELDEAGAVTSASRLVAWADGDALPLVSRGAATVLLVGWRGAEVDATAALAGRAAGFTARLRAASGCEQGLPAPAWAATWSAESTLDARDLATVPRLTTDGVDDACPELSARTAAVDLRCPATRCAPVTTRLGRCTLELDLASCALGTMRATFDVDGRACVELLDPTVDCTPRDEAPAAFTSGYSCIAPQSCELDVYFPPMDDEPPYFSKATLVDREAWLPESLLRYGNLYSGTLFSGHLHELVVLGDRAIVAAALGPGPSWHCPADGEQVPVQLLSVDASLNVTATSTAPDCIHRMTNDPIGGGFIATYAADRRWRLGRFDDQGHLVASAASEIPWDYWVISDVETLGDEVIILVGATGQSSQVHRHDLRTLARIRHHTIGFGTTGMTIVDERTLAFSSDHERASARWVVGDDTIIERADLPEDPDRREWVYGTKWWPETNEQLIATRGSVNIYLEAHPGRTFARATAFEEETISLSFTDWPQRGGVLAAGIVPITWAGTVVRFEPRARRFLQGTWTLGHGPIGRMRTAADGRVWLLLPWEGSIAIVGER
jgi:hypothetical protein